MAGDLTLQKARYLVDEQRRRQLRKDRAAGRLPDGVSDIPFMVRYLPQMVVGGLGGATFILAGILFLVLAGGIGQSDREAEREVSRTLASAVEAMAEADIKQAEAEIARAETEQRRLDREKRAEERRAETERKEQAFIMEMIFYAILIGLFLAVGAQYAKLWGIGIVILIIVFVTALIAIPGAADLVKLLLKGQG